MNILTVSAVVALFAIEACTASAPIQAVGARQVRVVTMTLEGGWTNGIYPNYTLSIPEDGSKISISKFIYSHPNVECLHRAEHDPMGLTCLVDSKSDDRLLDHPFRP